MNMNRSTVKLRKDYKKRYYWHVSLSGSIDIGKKLIVYPRDNDESNGRGLFEPNNPRICVAPSVIHCLTALAFDFSHEPEQWIYAYRTEKKCTAYYPQGIFDSHVTREKWICEPTSFVLEEVIKDEDTGWVEFIKPVKIFDNDEKDKVTLKLKKHMKLLKTLFIKDEYEHLIKY